MINVNNISSENYNEIVKSGVILVNISSSWCAPCKALAPILEQIAIDFQSENLNVSINKMDIDTNRDKAVELGVTSIPTIFVYKDGSIVDRHVGMIQKNKLKEMIKKHI